MSTFRAPKIQRLMLPLTSALAEMYLFASCFCELVFLRNVPLEASCYIEDMFCCSTYILLHPMADRERERDRVHRNNFEQ